MLWIWKKNSTTYKTSKCIIVLRKNGMWWIFPMKYIFLTYPAVFQLKRWLDNRYGCIFTNGMTRAQNSQQDFPWLQRFVPPCNAAPLCSQISVTWILKVLECWLWGWGVWDKQAAKSEVYQRGQKTVSKTPRCCFDWETPPLSFQYHQQDQPPPLSEQKHAK